MLMHCFCWLLRRLPKVQSSSSHPGRQPTRAGWKMMEPSSEPRILWREESVSSLGSADGHDAGMEEGIGDLVRALSWVRRPNCSDPYAHYPFVPSASTAVQFHVARAPVPLCEEEHMRFLLAPPAPAAHCSAHHQPQIRPASYCDHHTQQCLAGRGGLRGSGPTH